jgi:NAD(P)-dependent dehydrogenase (short-subunit alcohol dehydrogenase family)
MMTTAAEFAGKVAMVTGAARGIGQGSALAFAARGADVIVCDLLPDDGETVKQVENLGVSAIYVQTDVASPESVQAAVLAGIKHFGRLDYAHNNAGIGPVATVEDLTKSVWDQVMAINLTGVFLCMQHQLPHLLQTRGAVVNTASLWGVVGAAGMSAYAASKHGVIGLTQSAALEYGTRGVRINAIAPGPIQTPLTAAVPAEVIGQIIGRTAQQRYGQPREVGEVVAWLCSDSASYVTGALVPVDGGWLAG